MAKPFLLGCQWRGIRHIEEVSIEEKFRMLRDLGGVYDHMDRLPTRDVLDEHIRCSEKYGIPIHTGSVTYQVGRDEDYLQANLGDCKRVGISMHNIMLLARHADGHLLTEEEVADFYIKAHDWAGKVGIDIAFEVHVNNWSERFRMVRPVAERVRARGVPFGLTVDYSHCIFKIENPEEQEISDIRPQVEAGTAILDPYENGSFLADWLSMNMVVYVQFRPAVPNGPRNVWAIDPATGKPGRGIQYPFIKPEPGEFHSPWHAWKLEPCKEAIRMVFRHHLSDPDSPLRFMNTEYITLPDYGANARYSLFDNTVAAARWVRQTWDEMSAPTLSR